MSQPFIDFEKTETRITLLVNGEVDLSNSGDLRKSVLGALQTKQHVQVNLSGVEYIDSSGIAAMVEGLQYANSNGCRFELTSPSQQVRSILELARLDQVFTIV